MNERRTRTLGWVTCALTVALLAGTAGVAPADAQQTNKPDLKVKAARLSTVPNDGDLGFIVERGDTTRFRWFQRTLNRGQAAAPKSKTWLQIILSPKRISLHAAAGRPSPG